MLIELAKEQAVAAEDARHLELAALAALDNKLLVARDRIRQVARDETPGFYWHGRPGSGKTHVVLETVKEAGVKHHYEKGYVTAQGLLELMERHHDKVIILDDVSAIFSDKKAVQYLLAALGRMKGKALPMGYVRQGKEVRFKFSGGIICISNLAVENKGMLARSPGKRLAIGLGVPGVLAIVGYVCGVIHGDENPLLLAICCGVVGAFVVFLGYGPIALVIGALGAIGEWLHGKRDGPIQK